MSAAWWTAPGSATEPPMSRRNAEVVAEIYSAFDFKSAAAGRLDELFERLADPGFEIEPPPIYPDMGVYRGLDEVKGFFGMLTQVWEEWRFEPGEMEDAGDKVLVPVTLQARGRASTSGRSATAAC